MHMDSFHCLSRHRMRCQRNLKKCCILLKLSLFWICFKLGNALKSYPGWKVACLPAAGPLQAAVLREGDSQLRGCVVWGAWD